MTTQTLTRPAGTRDTATLLSSVALVASPLLLLGYFLSYPAYGETHASAVARAIAADTGTTQVSDVFALAGSFLAVPAILAMLRVLRPGSSRLAGIGAVLSIAGWMAVAVSVMTDVAAVELAGDEAAFKSIYTSPLVIGVNVTASLHIIGGVLLGIALVRTRVVPRALAIAAAAAPPVHLAANLGGQLWLDAITWIVMAVVGLEIARVLSRGSGVGG